MKARGPKSGFRKTITLRRKLRKDLTPAEKLFWAKVSNRQFLGLKFRRQHAVGNYIVDFYCPKYRLIIEIDGDTHALSVEKDRQRTKYLESLEYKVVRYNNRDVLNNIEGVFKDLIDKFC